VRTRAGVNGLRNGCEGAMVIAGDSGGGHLGDLPILMRQMLDDVS
jgi:hypothetical protein